MKIQPKNYGDEKCKNFASRYITTREMLEFNLSLTKTLIKLASSTISIPLFRVATTIIGIGKPIVICGVGYLSLLRAPLKKTCEFTFDVGAFVGFNFSHTIKHRNNKKENPIDTEITLMCIKGEVTMKKGAKALLLAKFHGKMEMFVPVRQIFANLPNMH